MIQRQVSEVGHKLGETLHIQDDRPTFRSLEQETVLVTAPPKLTSPKTSKTPVGSLLWIHLQTSICTEWEQNSMIIGSGVTVKWHGSRSPSPTVTSKPHFEEILCLPKKSYIGTVIVFQIRFSKGPLYSNIAKIKLSVTGAKFSLSLTKLSKKKLNIVINLAKITLF